MVNSEKRCWLSWILSLWLGMSSMDVAAQVDFQVGDTWLEGVAIDRVSFRDDGRIFYIYNDHRAIGYYDLVDGAVDITSSLNELGLTYFIDVMNIELKSYVVGNDGMVAVMGIDDLTIFDPAVQAGLDSITSIANSGTYVHPSEGGVGYSLNFSIGTTDGLYYFSSFDDRFKKLTTSAISYDYEGTAYTYDLSVSNVMSRYDYTGCPSDHVVSIFTYYGTYITTFSDSLNVLDLQSKRYSGYISPRPALYIGTDDGLIWKYWECNSGYFAHYLQGQQVYDVQFFSPFELLGSYYRQSNYTIAGSSNGLYYSGDPDGASDHYYTLVPGTGGTEYFDMTTNNCAGEIYAATTDGIVQIRSFENKSFIPYIAGRMSPQGEILYCKGDTVEISSGLGGQFDVQWFKDNDTIPGAQEFVYKATTPGTYNYALFNCFFEDLQFSDDLVVTPTEVVEFSWINPANITVCDSNDTLHVQTDTSNYIVWYRNGEEMARDTTAVIISAPGTYDVQITNCNGFVKSSPQTNVRFENLEKPEISVSDHVICEGEEVTLAVDSTGAAISWYYDGVEIDSLANQLVFATVVSGTYHAVASNAYCFTHSDTLDLSGSAPGLHITGSTYFCEGSPGILILSSAPTSDIFVNDKLSDGYLVVEEEVELLITVEDSVGCTFADTLQIYKQDLPEFALSSDTSYCFGDLKPLSLVLGSIYNDYWLNGGSTGNKVEITSPGQYEVIIKDTLGCNTQAAFMVKDDCPTIDAPNVFTPNGDGVNDYFEINNLIPNCRLSVFSRNGNLLYFSNNYVNDWSGKNLPNGIYYFRLENAFYRDTFTGIVQILR